MHAQHKIAESFDLADLSPAFYADPFPVYDALRTTDPQKRLADGSIFLTRYGDCMQVYRDTKSFSSDKTAAFKPKYGDSPLYEHHTTSLVFNDPPRHTRVRKLITAALTSRVISDLEPGLLATIHRLLDEMEAKAQADFVRDFASAIPIEIIGNLLNVPHAERDPLRDWSLKILGALEPTLSAQQLAAGNRAVEDFFAYLETLVADRTMHPGDPVTDILTRLIQGDVDGEKLSHMELLHNCIFILNAGHETTTNLIGNALVIVGEDPALRLKLIGNPDLLNTAVDEFLRFESPNQLGNRVATCTVEIGGQSYGPGTQITMCIGAANRDPEAFPQPNRFDPARSPNRHLAFASGIHQCAGMHVARLEGRLAVREVLARFPNYQLIGTPDRSQRARFRGFESIPVRLRT